MLILSQDVSLTCTSKIKVHFDSTLLVERVCKFGTWNCLIISGQTLQVRSEEKPPFQLAEANKKTNNFHSLCSSCLKMTPWFLHPHFTCSSQAPRSWGFLSEVTSTIQVVGEGMESARATLPFVGNRIVSPQASPVMCAVNGLTTTTRLTTTTTARQPSIEPHISNQPPLFTTSHSETGLNLTGQPHW